MKKKISSANYAGMHVKMWPAIHPEDQPIYDRLCAAIVRGNGMSRVEAAVVHRSVHYLLERDEARGVRRGRCSRP